jgi:dual specificity phosphatase 12
MLFSYYPSPYPSPTIVKTLTPFHSTNRLASPMRGIQPLASPTSEEPSSAVVSASNSSAGGASPTSTPSSSMLLRSSHASTSNFRRRRTFSSTSLPGKDGRPSIDLSISPRLPDSVELETAFPLSPSKPADYPSSSLAQPSSMEVKVTETKGRLPGGVPSLRGNETSHNRGQLSQPLYSGPKLRCKMCRRELASLHDHLIDHEPGKGQLAFEHKKRNAPGGAQASADTRTGIERANGAGSASGLGSQQRSEAMPAQQHDQKPSDSASTSESPVVTASPMESMAPTGRPIQSAASLSASLPPHLAALRMGRAPPPQQRPSAPTADSIGSISPNYSLSLDLSGISAHSQAQVKTTPLPGAGAPRPAPLPQSPSQVTLPSAACSAYFVEPLQWMSALKEGELSGRLDCPGKKCGVKLGSWDWAGMQCGW